MFMDIDGDYSLLYSLPRLETDLKSLDGQLILRFIIFSPLLQDMQLTSATVTVRIHLTLHSTLQTTRRYRQCYTKKESSAGEVYCQTLVAYHTSSLVYMCCT